MCKSVGLRNVLFYVALPVAFCTCSYSQNCFAMDGPELAAICEAMEKAIVDISLEYEWYNDPPLTIADISGTGQLIPQGPSRQSLTLKYPFPERLLYTEQAMSINEHQESFEDTTKCSYNGEVLKYFQQNREFSSRESSKEELRGIITKSNRLLPSLELSPLGFSVLRFQFGPETFYLSDALNRTDLVVIDETVENINGFDTIRADLLREWNKEVGIKVYFAIHHGYTPVRFEYMNATPVRFGSMNGPNIAFTVNVNSLEQVQEGIWFPSSGSVKSTDRERMFVYRATDKIIVNQDLKDEIFDMKFPPGTQITNELSRVKYKIIWLAGILAAFLIFGVILTKKFVLTGKAR